MRGCFDWQKIKFLPLLYLCTGCCAYEYAYYCHDLIIIITVIAESAYLKGFGHAISCSAMSKSYNILRSVETVSLDDGVEAVTQPNKPRSPIGFSCTRRIKLCTVVSALLVVVLLLTAVTIALIVVVVQDRAAGGGVGPTHPPPQCAQVPPVRLACRPSGSQPASQRECVAAGCCWNSSLSTPCFSEHPNSCPSAPSDRLICSSGGEAECTRQGCCWDDRDLRSSCFWPFTGRCPANDTLRFNCIPETTINQSNAAASRELCIQRACCWNTSSVVKCAFTLDNRYMVTSRDETPNGYSLSLAQKPNRPSLYGHDITNLMVDVTFETETRLHVQVHTHTHERIHTRTNVHTHTCTDTLPCTHMHTHTCTHTHTHTHAQTH